MRCSVPPSPSFRYRVSRSLVASSAVFVLAVLGIGCSAHTSPQPPNDPPAEDTKTLYERLGGEYAIALVVDDFIDRIAKNDTLLANDAVREKMPKESLAGLSFHVATLICQVSGGPCVYTGRDMKSSHVHLGINGSEWDAFAGDLVASMNHYSVPQAEQDELLALVATLRADIVTVPDAAAAGHR